MDSSTAADRQRPRNGTTAPSTRNSDQDQPRQVAVQDAARQQRRAASNREAARRQAQSAMRDSIERDRAMQRQNEQAGVEKMVRSVVRKKSGQAVPRRSQKTVQQKDHDAQIQAQYVRDKLNSAYSSSATESPQDESLRSSPSQHQQQRAIDDYQQSSRNSIDRTVELVT